MQKSVQSVLAEIPAPASGALEAYWPISSALKHRRHTCVAVSTTCRSSRVPSFVEQLAKNGEGLLKLKGTRPGQRSAHLHRRKCRCSASQMCSSPLKTPSASTFSGRTHWPFTPHPFSPATAQMPVLSNWTRSALEAVRVVCLFLQFSST